MSSLSMPRALDLFAGTHSFTKQAQELGWDVISVDLSPKYSPTHVANILDWDFKQYPRGYFQFLWCSPPCTLLSIAPAHLFTALQRQERAEASLEVVEKMIEILNWYQAPWYCIENPKSSALWRHLQGFETVTVSYCMYSDWGYKKDTKLATNVPFEPKLCRGQCGWVREILDEQTGKKHRWHQSVAKQGVSQHTRGTTVQQTRHTRDELYRVPPKLIQDILEAVGQVESGEGGVQGTPRGPVA